MFLMSRTTHHIIANSSYSWWGAWLGEKEDTVIIAPKSWFGQHLDAHHDQDLKPERWIKV
jgi:hypothetical protein